MKKAFLFLLASVYFICGWSQWEPAGDKIKTIWGENLDPENVLPEYPRPVMEREEWENLNGLWDYAILPKDAVMPEKFDGKILVPFAVESSLSGVQRTVGKDSVLWYRKTFRIPSGWKNRSILLNFGGVDWEADVWLNGIKLGGHKGGYTPFSFEISSFLDSKAEQELVIRVWDPTDKSFQPRGKQVTDPHGIWYTSVTGIWQTVWMEPVNTHHITGVYTIPDIDRHRALVKVSARGQKYGDILEVKVKEKGKTTLVSKASASEDVEINLENPTLWSPENPYLYDLEISLYRDNKILDQVKSYFAMRKISTQRDEFGIVRLQLNNKDYFQFGPLDQGWWPDGLYTAPTDEALAFDILKTKELGFNMIRKHVKVEPARWYTHCDRMGMLVWQDMPNGDRSTGWKRTRYFEGNELERSPVSAENFRREYQELLDNFRAYPSIVVWVPFNEAWGQFETKEIVEWTKRYDPGRLVNPASGGNHFRTGDILDLHNYPEPKLFLYDASRATVLGEYGGIGYPVEGHLWSEDKNWGYVRYKNPEEVTDAYIDYARQLKKLIKAGFSAAVYTQTTDVESEVNGFMTYDRKLIKVDPERFREINLEVRDALQ